MQKLPDVFRRRQVFEPVHPEIADARVILKPICNKFKRRLAKKDLLPVRNVLQSCGTIQCGAEVVVVPLLSFAGVQSHSYPKSADMLVPLLVLKC